MRPSLLTVLLVCLACGRDNPEWTLPDGGAADATGATVPPPAFTFDLSVAGLPSGTWATRGNGLLTNTCGVATPARGSVEWKTLALSPETVNLYTGRHRMVVLVRKSQIYEGEVAELVSPFPQCTIRDRLSYLVRMQSAERADCVLTERFVLAAGLCDGVLPLPCELAQHFEMVLR